MRGLIIGLTGPTGAGKSTAAYAARRLGFSVIDADAVAAECTLPGSPLLPELERAFSGVIKADGSLDRAALAAAAFSAQEKTQLMNSIMLPFIVEKIEHIINAEIKKGNSFILLDAPTLFEASAQRLCDCTVGLLCPYETRFKRITERDGIDTSAAKQRMDAGKPDEFYTKRCGYIIYNDGTKEQLFEKVYALFKKLKEGK